MVVEDLNEINLTNAIYQNLTGPITFRIYGWGATAPSGRFGINSFTFNGEVLVDIQNDTSIWNNSITNTNPSAFNPYTDGDVKNSNITVSGIGRGNGIIARPTSNRYDATGWNSLSLDNEDYYEFTLQPNPGYKINFNSFVFDGQTAAISAPTNFALRSSLDGYSSNIGVVQDDSNSISLVTPIFQNISSAITFRIFAWGGSALDGRYGINSFEFKGSVVNTGCVSPTLTTTGVIDTVCNNPTASTTVILPYSGSTGNPIGYSIDWNLEASNAGLIDQSNPAEIFNAGPGNVDIVIAANINPGAYSGVITIGTGNCVTNYQIFLTILPPLNPGSIATTGEIICSGGDPVVIGNVTSASGGDENITYQWASSTDGFIYLPIPGSNSLTYDPPAGLTQKTWYLREANDGTCVTAFGGAATRATGRWIVDVIPSLNPGSIATTGEIICSGGDPVVIGNVTSASGGDENITYQWASSTDGFIYLPIPGSNSLTYDPPAGLTQKTWYLREANDGTCVTAFGGAATRATGRWIVDVKTTPLTPTIDSISNVNCVSQGTITLSGLPTSNWLIYQTGSFNASYSGTSNSFTISNLAVGNYIFTVESITENCPSNPTSSITISNDSSTTWNGSIWTNGNPDATKNVIISSPLTLSSNIEACSLLIENGISLTVPSDIFLVVTNEVIINGDLILQDKASLVQINEATNTGTMHLTRTTSLKNFDYVYWSSPVSSFNVNAISPLTTIAPELKWEPTILTNLPNNYGNWVSTSEDMVIGRGYAVRAPDGYPVTPTPFSTTFVGTPNNGTITIPISRGTYDGPPYDNDGNPATADATQNDDNFNLIGNPYPSAISARAFLDANPNVDGFVNIWSHGKLPSSAITSPFYSTFVYNYAPTDYITYNKSGQSTGPGSFNGNIASGQAFFVLMKSNTAATTENVTFTNAMRSTTYDNDHFFRNPSEEGRIWLDVVAQDDTHLRTLVAYVDGATNSIDRDFDAITDKKPIVNIFSICEGKEFKIQGRPTPLNQDDEVPIGVTIPFNGFHHIAIGALDGIFLDPSQDIFLEDLELNTIHDLKADPYFFAEVQGVIENRFILKFKNTLSNPDSQFDKEKVIAINGEEITVKSQNQLIQSIKVFDVLGREIKTYDAINNQTILLKDLPKTKDLKILKVTLENGVIKTLRVIY